RDGDVHPDQFTRRVHERPTGVAGVDGGVGLNDGDRDGRRLGRAAAGLLAEVPEVEWAALAALTLALVAVLLGRVIGHRRRGDLDAAVEGAHDAVGDRVGQPERCTDRYRLIADVEVAGVGELN